MQQFSEEENRLPSNGGEEVEQQVFTVIRQMALNLLQYQSVRFFLLAFCCIILAALIQAGLLGPLIIIVLIGTVVFLARGQAVINILERWTDAPLSPLLQKLLIGTSLGSPKDDLMQTQSTMQQRFAEIRTMDDLRLIPPAAFEQLVGETMQHMNYAQVEVVGRSRDLCVDIKALGPHGEQVAVQCKRYTTKNVNSDEMQKFIGMIYLHHRADRGMYFTTSSYTKEARKLGQDNRIDLIDGQGLLKIIRALSF